MSFLWKTGPFTLALHLLGTDIFLKMFEDPEYINKLFDITKFDPLIFPIDYQSVAYFDPSVCTCNFAVSRDIPRANLLNVKVAYWVIFDRFWPYYFEQVCKSKFSWCFHRIES